MGISYIPGPWNVLAEYLEIKNRILTPKRLRCGKPDHCKTLRTIRWKSRLKTVGAVRGKAFLLRAWGCREKRQPEASAETGSASAWVEPWNHAAPVSQALLPPAHF